MFAYRVYCKDRGELKVWGECAFNTPSTIQQIEDRFAPWQSDAVVMEKDSREDKRLQAIIRGE